MAIGSFLLLRLGFYSLVGLEQLVHFYYEGLLL